MTNSPRWSALLRRNDLPAALTAVARLTSLAALAALAATSVVLEAAR
ncbi:hypothetical protein AB0E59_05410 [Lentzea sp. NPDC034063]